MENLQLSKEQVMKRTFIFAFPGMGKTPLALHKAGYIDADFGYLRTAFKVDKTRERVLFKPYVRLIHLWAQDGYKVLSNQPDIMQFVNHKQAVCILPLNSIYSARKMKVDKATVDGWIQGWVDQANKVGIPVVWIDTGLDKYLK